MDTKACAQVHPGIYQLQRANTNCFLLVTDNGITLIDAGFPRMWPVLLRVLRALGAQPRDISAVLLTHGHFDHVGIAERLRSDHAVPVLVHADDLALARKPFSYAHESARLAFLLRHMSAVPIMARMAGAGMMWTRGVAATPGIVPGERVDVPGAPVPIASPGHTNGHCGFYLPDRGVLFTGDALVTIDPYTARRGPRIVAPAATADTSEALESLHGFEALDAPVVLTGHGPPWTSGAKSAVARARVASRE